MPSIGLIFCLKGFEFKDLKKLKNKHLRGKTSDCVGNGKSVI